MDNYLFPDFHSSKLFNSITRYFKYVLNTEITCLSESKEISPKSILFIFKEERDNPALLEIITNNQDVIIVTLGYDGKSTINIFPLEKIKEKFQKILDGNSEELKPLFMPEELREKLKNFFTSHGEDSLFEYLSWTIYYFRNGPLQFINNVISYDDYKKLFISLGLRHWEYFKSRFIKYKNILKYSNYLSAIDELEEKITLTDNYITGLVKMDEKVIMSKNEKFFIENLGNLERIEYILIKFYQDLKFDAQPL